MDMHVSGLFCYHRKNKYGKAKTGNSSVTETANTGGATVDIGSREHMGAVNPEVIDAPGACLWHLYP